MVNTVSSVAFRLITLLSFFVTTIMAVEITIELPRSPILNATHNVEVIIKASGRQTIESLPAPISNADFSFRMNGNISSRSMDLTNNITVITYEAAVLFKRIGTITFPPLQITLGDGTTASTKAHTVEVKKAKSLTGLAVAEARVNPATIVPGQPVVVTYDVYTNASQGIFLRDIGWNIESALLQEGETEQNVEITRSADGGHWRHYQFTQKIRGTAPGQYTIGGQQDYYRQVRTQGSIFANTRNQKVGTIAIKPATLTIQELPTENRPVDYSGLVGTIDVQATLDRARIAVGETAIYSLTIFAEQAQALRRPKPPRVDGLYFYEREDDHHSARQRTFSWYVEPSHPSTFSIPSPGISYFDTNSMRYERGAAEALTLDAVPGRSTGP